MEHQPPVTRGFDLTPDLLASQGRALRGLARSLLGDSHAAEDVVQETWLACLKRPGAYPERISAWLGTMTKHLALHRLRGEGRRTVRERRAAGPERLEALQQRTLEREEALRAVTQALLALEEPLKTALLLRYYEDRTPNEIAAELGVPLATIKSRLARGLERLRARLGHEFEGDDLRRTRALYAIAGLRVPSAVLGGAAGATASTLGTLALATKLLAAALLLSSGIWWWNRAPQESRGLTSASTSSVVAASLDGRAPQDAGRRTSVDPVGSLENGAGARRESAATESHGSGAADDLSPEASYPYRITGQIRDEFDLPLAGARVFLAPHGFPLNHMGSTDDTGHFTFEFAGRRPTFDCVFTADGDGGRMLGFRELHLVSGQELVVDVGLNLLSDLRAPLIEMQESENLITIQQQDRPVTEKLHYRFEGAAAETLSAAVSILGSRLRYSAQAPEPLERAPAAARGRDGRSVFVDPPPVGVCSRSFALAELETLGRSVHEPAAIEVAITQSSRLHGVVSRAGTRIDIADQDRPGEDEVFIEGELLELDLQTEDVDPSSLATIRGVVRDALGNPVPNAELGWATPGAAFERVSSDENGAFELRGVTAGEVEVRAGGGDHGRARTLVKLAANEDLLWNPVLERGDEVTGRVALLHSGSAYPGVRVELWSVSPTFLWSDSTLTDGEGRFAIPNVPAGALELHVYASGRSRPPSAFPVRTVGPLFAPSDLGEIVLGEQDLETNSLALAVLDPHGDPLPGSEVRVWQDSTGRGCFAGEADEAGKHALAGLPRGSYRVEVGGPFGWHELGTIWVDEDLELAPERFAPAGLAQIEGVPAGSTLRASLWSAHPDVFGLVEGQELGRVTMLRAGDYVLCASDGERRLETSLAVKPGSVNALALETSSSNITVQPRTFAPAFEGSTQGMNCGACHVSGQSGG